MTEFGDLRAHQQGALRQWRANYLDATNPQVGLWVWGDRRAGSSTIADIALSQAVHGDKLTWEYSFNSDVMDTIRRGWSASEIARHLPNDYDLYVEANEVETAVESLWTTDVLFVDDLTQGYTDFGFWYKHVWPRIEKRLKQRKVTIIATDMEITAPPLADVSTVIKDLFVTCYAER